MLEGLLLGLSSGSYCLISCAPVALPFFFSMENSNNSQNRWCIVWFLLGRLLGYVLVGAIIGATSSYALGYLDPVLKQKLVSYSNVLIGILLFYVGLVYNWPHLRLCKKLTTLKRGDIDALLLGLLTGINVCPPFLVAATRLFGGATTLDGMAFFGLFFVGTAVYFLPLLGISLLRQHLHIVQMVARLALLFMGVYYAIFQGLLMLA